MKAVFADTSYYLALLSESDARHEQAVGLSRSNLAPIVLTDFILLELGNAMHSRASRGMFVGLLRHLRSDPTCMIVPVSKPLFEAGLQLYTQRPDKDWSLTDCTSFAVMRHHRLTDALSADRHFEQAGFKVLLK
jgi:hypothetical protein